MMMMRLLLLPVLLANFVASQHTVGARYEAPLVGPCRGPGGVNDKVNSRSAVEHTQKMCEDACDALTNCVGYAYCGECNGGECLLYGPGVDGTCSDPSALNEVACEALGACADASKLTKDTCGACSEPTATSKSTCNSVAGTWGADTWTSAGETWEDAEDPWRGSSHFSTIIRGSTEEVASKYVCLEIDPADHLAQCNGASECVTAFSGLTEADQVAANCPEGCEFVAAPTVPRPKLPHPGDIALPGWDPALSGACRGGATFTDKVNGKYSNTAGASGGSLTQAECAQECLDEPLCVGYAHSVVWCVIYGTEMHMTPGEGWTSDNHEATAITGTKANPSYICVTGPPRSLSEGLCFAGENTVETEGGEYLLMKDLKIGDVVKVDEGQFECIQSFGHYNLIDTVNYLGIHFKDTKKVLEISAQHMIFNGEDFVPAGTIKKGDYIQLGTGGMIQVSKVTNISRVGMYAPFTASGKIVVNNVLASTYISFESDSAFVTVVGMKTPVTYQWLAHAWMAPQRVWASWGFLVVESYDEEGISHWVSIPHKIGLWFASQSGLLKIVSLFALLVLTACLSLIECRVGLVVAFCLSTAYVLVRIRFRHTNKVSKRSCGFKQW